MNGSFLLKKEIKTQDLVSIFVENNNQLDAILIEIANNARKLVADVSSAKGRAAIASNAAKVASSKAAIEKAGKDLADKQKEIPRLIDASRKKSRDFLDALKEEIRMPLTIWENEQIQLKIEKEKIEKEKEILLDWEQAFVLNKLFDVEKAKQKEKEEKERLLFEQKMLEKFRLEAEQKAEKAIEQAEKEKIQAQQREKQAIEFVKIAKENAKLLEKQRLIDAENEINRAKEEAVKQKAIDDAKKSDINYRNAIKTTAKNALMKNGFTEEQSIIIVNLACEKKLGALKIEF